MSYSNLKCDLCHAEMTEKNGVYKVDLNPIGKAEIVGDSFFQVTITAQVSMSQRTIQPVGVVITRTPDKLDICYKCQLDLLKQAIKEIEEKTK